MKHLLVAAILSGILLAPLAVRAVDAPACTARGPLPDATCTPGATNPQVTQATIGETICARDWTATVRPPVHVTNAIKVERMAAYGLADQPMADYELDHLVSLELGGAPDDVTNVWPEAWNRADGLGAHAKDAVENASRRAACANEIPLDELQHDIATDWVALGWRLNVPGLGQADTPPPSDPQ